MQTVAGTTFWSWIYLFLRKCSPRLLLSRHRNHLIELQKRWRTICWSFKRLRGKKWRCSSCSRRPSCPSWPNCCHRRCQVFTNEMFEKAICTPTMGSLPLVDAILAGVLRLVCRNFQGTRLLTKLLIQSLVSGIFLDCYKTSMIHPLLKNGNLEPWWSRLLAAGPIRISSLPFRQRSRTIFSPFFSSGHLCGYNQSIGQNQLQWRPAESSWMLVPGALHRWTCSWMTAKALCRTWGDPRSTFFSKVLPSVSTFQNLTRWELTTSCILTTVLCSKKMSQLLLSKPNSKSV